MNLTKTLGLAFLGSALLFTSCKKDDDDAPDNTQTCKVDKQYYFDDGGTTASDTASYTYNGDKISSVNVSGITMNYEYSGNNVTKRNWMVPGVTTPAAYDQITYNTDGTINKVETFFLEQGSTNYLPVWRTDFTYTSGKIAGISQWDQSSGTEVKLAEYTYTFTGNNITQLTLTDFEDPSAPETFTINVAYDGNNNYTKKQNAQAFLIDPFIGNLNFIDQGLFLPLFFSANNVTAFSAGTSSYPVTYKLDDKQNLTEINVPDLDTRTTFTYLCQ